MLHNQVDQIEYLLVPPISTVIGDHQPFLNILMVHSNNQAVVLKLY